MMTTDKTDHARANALAQLEHISGLMHWLDHTNECDDRYDCTWTNAVVDDYASDTLEAHDSDTAQRAISEHPLSVEVRSAWYTPGSDRTEPVEFCILLTTGGPACRIIGLLDVNGQPVECSLEYQDWGVPWTVLYQYGPDDYVTRYCQQFYYGE